MGDKNGQSTETGNIGYTRYTQDKYTLEKSEWVTRMDNPQKLATLDTQDTGQIFAREI